MRVIKGGDRVRQQPIHPYTGISFSHGQKPRVRAFFQHRFKGLRESMFGSRVFYTRSRRGLSNSDPWCLEELPERKLTEFQFKHRLYLSSRLLPV